VVLSATISPLGRNALKTDMIPASILVVEDEHDIRELITYHLLKEGYQVAGVASAAEALAMLERQRPDLVLLDLMLPDMDGLALCRRLKGSAATAGMMIVMLTAKGEEADVVTGLNAGAQDYITKPFSPRVLMARVRAALRRSRPAEADGQKADGEGETITLHNLKIHLGRHEVLVDGQRVELSSTEFRVLHFLARRPGWVFTRQQILDGVHGDKYAITDRAVDVQIVALRRKLGEAGRAIETVRGVGYRFKE
jgi:two-component system phosphate regulon response regulator PhoB